MAQTKKTHLTEKVKRTIRRLTKNSNKNIQKIGIKTYKKWEYSSIS